MEEKEEMLARCWTISFA